MPSFDILRILIRRYKDDELDYESFSDAVDEFSSQATEKYRLVEGLPKFVENLENYNFSDMKALEYEEKLELAEIISRYITEYLTSNGLSEEWDEDLDGDHGSEED